MVGSRRNLLNYLGKKMFKDIETLLKKLGLRK